ncbi:hypothetical protein PILCRDRAFT_115624 [Piloderma croceum F 1598]|uniref:Uncharacterized protein n=1 Tax=Piloderma croceum (strain F 1598) TaxID=765440 RepID=A0A0C3GNV6_PILCF|nr:hypothetical protein PILCRDRAFT_115624 [Piloderma croceum F 1598]
MQLRPFCHRLIIYQIQGPPPGGQKIQPTHWYTTSDDTVADKRVTRAYVILPFFRRINTIPICPQYKGQGTFPKPSLTVLEDYSPRVPDPTPPALLPGVWWLSSMNRQCHLFLSSVNNLTHLPKRMLKTAFFPSCRNENIACHYMLHLEFHFSDD